MMRWNREAAMLGIPDLPEEGFKHVGDRKIKPQGGSGGGGQQTSTQYTTNVPEYARPQFQEMLGRGIALSEAEYQPYGGERLSGFTPMQQQAFQQAGQQGVAPQLGQASGLAGLASLQGLQAGQFQPGTFTPMGVQGPQLQQFQLGAPMGVGTQTFAQPGAAEQFMSPYMQNVVDIQQREAQRQADIAGTQRGAQAVRAGAFGGSRQAVMDAEAQRNLAQQMGDIQATGSQAAFQQAQQQFNQEQQARLQAQMANQAAGLTAGQANLQALLGTQQLGAQTGMQAQLANQQALMDAQRAFEQSRQFGADVGLRGGAQALQGAGILGQLGQQQFGQEMDVLGLQRDVGREQQMQEQQRLDQQFADFQAQRDFPYQQIGFLSDLLRGAGSSTRSIYSVPQPGAAQTLAGLGMAGAGLGGLFAKGGEVKGYADGGIMGLLGDDQLQQVQSPMDQIAAQQEMMQRQAIRDQAPASMPREHDMTEQELLSALEQAIREGDRTKARIIQELIEERKMPDSGIASIAPDSVSDIPAGAIAEMAGGGMVSFAQGTDARGIRSPYQMTDEEFQQSLLEEQAMQLGRGEVAGPTAEELMQAHGANPRMMQGLPPVTPPTPDGNVSTEAGIGALGIPEIMGMYQEAGYNPQAEQAQQLAFNQAAQAARADRISADRADLQRMIEERGVYAEEREAALKDELEGLTGKKETAKSMALFQAGLAILSADPSRGAFAAIGEGALQGLGAYKGDVEKLEERRSKINDRMDRIADIRRQERMADDRDRLALQKEENALTEANIRDTAQILKGFGDERRDLAKAIVNQAVTSRERELDRQFREENLRNRSVADLAQMRISLDQTIRRLETKSFLEPEEEIELRNARADRDEIMRRLAGRQGIELPSQRPAGGTLTQADQDLINKYR